MADTQVWLVTSGEYSDYRIEAVFGSEEAANKYAVAHGFAVEGPQPLYRDCPDPIPVLCLATKITRDRISDPRERVTNSVPGIDPEPDSIKVGGRRYAGAEPYIRLTVEGTDHERVRKVYSERATQALARFDELRAQPDWPN